MDFDNRLALTPSDAESATLSPIKLANQSGRGWVWIWNRRIDTNADFARGIFSAFVIIRKCPSRNLDFEVHGGILAPTLFVKLCLVHHLAKNHGVRLPDSVIWCILNHYRGYTNRFGID